jgi:hypothetical protein
MSQQPGYWCPPTFMATLEANARWSASAKHRSSTRMLEKLRKRAEESARLLAVFRKQAQKQDALTAVYGNLLYAVRTGDWAPDDVWEFVRGTAEQITTSAVDGAFQPPFQEPDVVW